MKKLSIKKLLPLLTAIFILSACKKEVQEQDMADKGNSDAAKLTSVTNAFGSSNSSNDVAAPVAKNGSSTCLACDLSNNYYDLLQSLKTMHLTEGDNIIIVPDNGLKAIARIKKGINVQWIVQDKAGKEYLPQSTEALGQQVIMDGYTYPVIRVCYYVNCVNTCFRAVANHT